MITFKIGRTMHVVADFAAASKAYVDYCNANDLGSRDAPSGAFKHEGKAYHVSYNGKVWEGKERVPCGTVQPLVYNPYSE